MSIDFDRLGIIVFVKTPCAVVFSSSRGSGGCGCTNSMSAARDGITNRALACAATIHYSDATPTMFLNKLATACMCSLMKLICNYWSAKCGIRQNVE